VRWTLIVLSAAFIGLTTPALFGQLAARTYIGHNAIFFGAACVFVALNVDVWCARPRASCSVPELDRAQIR
jgi:hypothetical protein